MRRHRHQHSVSWLDRLFEARFNAPGLLRPDLFLSSRPDRVTPVRVRLGITGRAGVNRKFLLR